jgi:hypothetical protein
LLLSQQTSADPVLKRDFLVPEFWRKKLWEKQWRTRSASSLSAGRQQQRPRMRIRQLDLEWQRRVNCFFVKKQ